MAMPATSAFAQGESGHGADKMRFEPLKTTHTRPFQSLLTPAFFQTLSTATCFPGVDGGHPTANLLVQ